MNRTFCLRLSRLALPMLLAALVSSACAQQSTKGDSKTVPFQVTFEPNGAVIVKTPEGKRLEPVPANFHSRFLRRRPVCRCTTSMRSASPARAT